MSTFKAGKGANQPWAGKEKTIAGAGKMETEGSGVKYGLSDYQANMDTQQNEPMVDNDVDPMTGYATERIKQRKWHSASNHGKSFMVEE
jgi:hypothetical protein